MYLGAPCGSDRCNSYLVHLRSEHPSIYPQRRIALERPTKGAAANFRPPRPAWNALQLLLNNWRIMRGVIMRPMIMARTGIIISGELAGFGTKSTGFHSGCSWFIGTDRLQTHHSNIDPACNTTPVRNWCTIPLQHQNTISVLHRTNVQYQPNTLRHPQTTPERQDTTTWWHAG